jgi:hypothetical protein
MIRQRRAGRARIALLVALVLGMAAVAGCTAKTADTAVKSGATALGSLPAARSALATAAPDAKLLVVQTAEAVESTATPVWAYLFGSPSTDKTYLVYVANGVSMGGAQEYGEAGLQASEWAQVPGTDAWKIDSDAAYAKALAISGAKGVPNAYMMGMLTYKSATDTSTVQPFVWNVLFDPGESGATSSTINVNAGTGAAVVTTETFAQ